MAGKRGFEVKKEFYFSKVELFFLGGFFLAMSLVLTLIFFSGQVSLSPGEQVSLERALPSSATIGVPFAVVLNLDVDENNLPSVVGVEEFVPEGWQVSGVSHGGKVAGNKIEWLFLNGVPLVSPIEDSVISYTIIPKSLSGDFSGDWISGEGEGNITGDNSIVVSESSDGSSGGGSGGSGSSGGGSGGGGIVGCVPKWKCGWGACIDGEQKISCIDLNGCSLETGKPAEQTKSCNMELQSNRTGAVASQIVPTTSKSYLWQIIGGLILVVVIFIIVILTYRSRKSRKEYENLIAQARELVLEYRRQGYSEEQITKLFRERNWGDREIRRVLYRLKGNALLP